MSLSAFHCLDSIENNRLSEINRPAKRVPIKLAASFLAATFVMSVNATTGLSPNTPFEIDGNPESASGVEFDFLNQAGTAIGGYGPGTFMGTPYSGTEGNTFLVIDGGDDSCDGTPGEGVTDTSAVLSSINFNDPDWPPGQIGTGGVSNKTELCSIYVAAEIIQNGSEFENILYVGGYFEPNVTGNRGYSIPLFDTFTGTSPTTGDCIIDFRVGTNAVNAVEYTCYTDGSGWAPVGVNTNAFQCTLIRPDGFFECAANLDQLGVIPQDECVTFEVGSIISRASGSSYNTQLEDVVDAPAGGVVIDNCGSVEISKVAYYANGVPQVDPLPTFDFTYFLENNDDSPVHDDTLVVLANDENVGDNTAIQDTFSFAPPAINGPQTWDNVIFSPDFVLSELTLPGDWELEEIECTYENIFVPVGDPNREVTVMLDVNANGTVNVSDPPLPGEVFTINNDDSTTTTCTITNVDKETVPVTLSSFSSIKKGSHVEFAWGTSSELFNVGFQLWGLDGADGQWDKLHNWLIKSGSGNAVEPQSYAKRVKIPNSIDQLVSVGLSSVDSDGSEHYYGPFELGESYGELGQLEPIAWDAVRAELDASMLAQGYVKDRVHGYRKVAVSEAGAVQSAASSTQTVIEFRVREDGLYRLTSSELSAAGMDLSGALKRDIAIIDSAGDAVVRYVKSGKTFGSKGEVYFYGQGPDETAGIYTESSVYRLVLDRYRALNAPKQGKQGVSSGFSAHYVETSAVEQDNIYLFSSSADDPWVTQVLVSEPGKPRLYGLSVPIEADALSSEPKHIALGLGKSSALGGVGDEHEVQGVVLSPAGENGVLYLASRASSSGSGLWEVLLEIPSGTPLTVTDGEAVVGGLFSVGSGYAFSEVHLDSMGLRYARPYVSKAGDNYLIFTAPNDGELGYEVEVPNKGYPWVFATDGSNLVRLIPENAPKSTNADGEQVRTVRFAALAGAGLLSEGEALRYWVGARTQALSVEGLIEKSVVSQADLVAQAGGSNYLLISHPSFLGSALDAYVLHKQGEGYGVSVINYLEIEDSFGGGQSGPAGLTRYISAVKAAYGQLDYVLVVGGSTYDHTDKLGTGAVTFIPGHYGESNHSQYTVSDVPYVQDEAGGLFASIGRWPVRTMDDVQAIVDKSMAWGTPTHTSSELLLIAEHTMAGEGIDFGGALDGIAQVFGGFYDQSRVYVDSILADLVDALMASDPTLTQAEARAQALPQAIGQAKGEIIGELSGTSGAPSPDIVLYNGHASTGQLSNYNLFKSSDVSGLVDAVGSELWVPMSCYVTWYEGAAVNSLAHQLLFTGNAMTITGAMLLSNQGENIQMGTSILNSTVNEGSTLGEAVKAAKAAQNNPNVDINWAILGDPTVSLSSP